MAIQRGVATATNKVSSSASMDLSFASAPSAGSFVGVIVESFPSVTWAANGCTDNQGNTYPRALQLTDATNNISIAIYFCPAIGTPSGTVTVTLTPPSASFMVGAITNWTGVSASTTPAGTNTNSGDFLAPSTDLPTTGTVSLGSSAERLAMAVVGLSGSQSAITIAGTGTWTEEVEDLTLSFNPGEGDSQVATATGYEAHYTDLNSSTNWIAGIAVFEAVAAGGGGRTTKNTRSFPLGVEVGMNWRGRMQRRPSGIWAPDAKLWTPERKAA